MRALLLSAWLAVLAPAASALPPAPQLAFDQRLGEPLPLGLGLRDEGGRAVRLGDYFGQAPVVLVLGYFHCPNLCSTVMDGVLESLARTGLPAGDYRLLAVSIDPAETPAVAREKARGYRALLGAVGEAHFLTGPPAATAAVARAAGFPYRYDAALRQYLHPAGFLVATPDGRIARYFLGVRFSAEDVRLALTEAAAGRLGTLADRLLLLCAHYDPHTGRYTVAVMTVVRGVCTLLAAVLGGWIWRRARAR